MDGFGKSSEMDLERVQEGTKSNDAVFSQLFFVMPGDYRVEMALYDTATSEHTMSKRKLHVAALRNDPLPEAWRGLPAVEFVNPSQPPDSWYLPSIQGRLSLKVEPREPVQVNLVVNLTPSERLTGSSRAQSRNLAALLPATKIFSQIDWGSAGFSLALLDLSRRKVSYEQSSPGPLVWSKAGASLGEVNPAIIDVKSLGNRKLTAQFFVEIQRRAATPHKQTVLIVLTNAVEFESARRFVRWQWTGPRIQDVLYSVSVAVRKESWGASSDKQKSRRQGRASTGQFPSAAGSTGSAAETAGAAGVRSQFAGAVPQSAGGDSDGDFEDLILLITGRYCEHGVGDRGRREFARLHRHFDE